MVLLPDLSRLAVASGLRDHLLYIFRADLGGIVADVDDVALPVQVDIGDVRLLSKGSLDGTGAVQAMNAAELERAALHRNMVGVSCCRGPGVVVSHGGYLLLSTPLSVLLPIAWSVTFGRPSGHLAL